MKKSLHPLILLATFCLLLLEAPLCCSAQPAPRNPFLAPTALRQPASGPAVPAALSEPPVLQLYALSYAKAAEAADALKSLFKGQLSVDTITNSLLLNGTPQEQQKLSGILRQLDIPSRQVTLEAKIIAVSREHNKSLGVNWNWDAIPRRGNYESDDDTDTASNNYDGNFKFWRGYAFRFNATLNALISQGKAKVLATPRIITIPGKEASIFIGDHIPVQTEKHDNSGSYMSTEYLDAGIKLQYTPLVSSDGRMVTAQVHTEVSTPVLISELRNYRITSRTADTNVRMFSGETLVIGGLINEEEQNSLQKVPFLGDLPLLGNLFKSRTKKRSKVEVLLLLTPHITEAGASPAIYNTALEQEENTEA